MLYYVVSVHSQLDCLQVVTLDHLLPLRYENTKKSTGTQLGVFGFQPGRISSFQGSMFFHHVISSYLFDICCSPQTPKQYAIILVSLRVFHSRHTKPKDCSCHPSYALLVEHKVVCQTFVCPIDGTSLLINLDDLDGL